MRKIYWLLMLALMTSCAYLMGGAHKITVTTSTGKPAFCTLKNLSGEWRGYTGRPININTERGGILKISCVMNNYHAYKAVKAHPKKGYPDNVMVTMRPKKATDVESYLSPRDNDEESASELGGEDIQHDPNSRPLNVLPDGPDEDNEVIIIKH